MASVSGLPGNILRKYSASLTEVIAISFGRVATALSAEGLIPSSTQTDLQTMLGIADYDKACRIMSILQTNLQLSSNPAQYLCNICGVLITIKDNQLLKTMSCQMLTELGVDLSSYLGKMQ